MLSSAYKNPHTKVSSSRLKPQKLISKTEKSQQFIETLYYSNHIEVGPQDTNVDILAANRHAAIYDAASTVDLIIHSSLQIHDELKLLKVALAKHQKNCRHAEFTQSNLVILQVIKKNQSVS